MTAFDFSDLPIVIRSRLLTRLVAPRPIAFVSTLSAAGVGNLSPFSFFTAGGSNPPSIVFCTVNDRHGNPKHTLENIAATGEYVINIATYAIADRMNTTSYDYHADIDEFDKSGLTRLASVKVKPPGVAESPARIECRLYEIVRHGRGASAGSYVIGEILYATVEDTAITDGLPDNTKLDQLARLGGDYYLRASPESLFVLPRPTAP